MLIRNTRVMQKLVQYMKKYAERGYLFKDLLIVQTKQEVVIGPISATVGIPVDIETNTFMHSVRESVGIRS